MLTEKQKAQRYQNLLAFGRKLRCTKCDLIMRDAEPFLEEGWFFHIKNGCPNGGHRFDWNTPRFLQNRHRLAWKEKPVRFSGIERVVSKRYARSRARGAKLASKHRPK